jgi:hypothetical protein
MKPESRLDIAKRQVVEGEADVARQTRIIQELTLAGHTTLGARTMLRLFEDALARSQEELRLVGLSSHDGAVTPAGGRAEPLSA